MTLVAFSIFLVLIGLAAAFPSWPILRWKRLHPAPRFLAAAAVVFLVMGLGGGVYYITGSPYLAARGFSEPSPNDLRGLVAALAERVRTRPDDVAGWTLLGRGYLTLNDPSDAAAAFRRALAVANPEERPTLYSAFGEALTMAAGGAVGPEAEDAFSRAVAANPKDFAARFYLGHALAARGDIRRALALWQSLLADSPPNAPWRGRLVDSIAMLKAQSGTGPPDIGQMVAQLANRLHRRPEDPDGWQRLIRAYVVLGDLARAKAALVEARNALSKDAAAQARLALEARELKLLK